MAPAVPFALLGVVQLVAVAAWLGLAGGALFPRLRRRVSALFVVGALGMAVADALTALRFGDVTSDPLAWLRVVSLAALGVGAAGGSAQSLVLSTPAAAGAVVVPLGAGPAPALAGGVAGVAAGAAAWWRGLRTGADRLLGALLGAGLVASGVAAALAQSADTSTDAALALLAVRALASALIVGVLVQLARTVLLGKIVGAILAGVVATAAAAVGVVGTGVADEVQSQQSQRLLQVATGQEASLASLATRASLFARVVAQCPGKRSQCEDFLRLFSEQPDYFAVIVGHGSATVVSPSRTALSNTALVQLVGSQVVQQVLRPGALSSTAANDILLLAGAAGRPPKLALVTAVPGRPNGSSDARVRPSFAAVYGIGIVDAYLRSVPARSGYDLSVIADGQVLASSLPTPAARRAVLAEALSAHVDDADVSTHSVVAAHGNAPTAAFVPVTSLGNGDVRVATLAVSQPANEALAAQRSVLRRLFLATLAALVVVALLAIALARRIADPVRRLTVAAGRVRRGDLDATTTVSSRDEVGRLSRAFDAMTASLRGLTADLRATAAEEAALRARLETVVNSMSDGLVVTDARDVVTSANPTALALLGLDSSDVVGRRLEDVVQVEDAEGRPLLVRALRRAGTLDGELVCAGESRVPVRFGAAPLADGQGRVVVLADRRREHEVERMKTEFLANVSHELRTPLTPIRGYAEMIARRPELTREQVTGFVDEILSSTRRMSRAVELLVDVAALEGGRVAAERTPVSVRSLVDERVEKWRERYPERASDFKRRIAAKLPAVDIDRHWVSRALDELVDNAVKYTPDGSAITIVAAPADDGTPRVQVGVRDAGPGFEPALLGELVGDFSQADASETRRVGGLGLGLGFVSRVVERFGLELLVDTEPGKGSHFVLLLPAAAEAPAAPSPRVARRPRSRLRA